MRLKLPAAEYVKDHDQAENGGYEIPYKPDGRITEDQGFHACGNDHGAADNYSTQDDGERQAVADIVQAFLQPA